MDVSPDCIRRLRDERAWSQQHLADAAGLGLRTVQRVERDGRASAETRLALAAAFGVALELLAPEDLPAPVNLESGATGAVVVFGSGAAALLFVLLLGTRLPDPVVSHFDLHGQPDGWMPLSQFVLLMCACAVSVPALLWAALRFALRRGRADIPHAQYWMDGERRHASEAFLLRHGAWFSVALAVFFCLQFWLVAQANAARQPLEMPLVLGAVAALLLFSGGWLAWLLRRFGRPPG